MTGSETLMSLLSCKKGHEKGKCLNFSDICRQLHKSNHDVLVAFAIGQGLVINIFNPFSVAEFSDPPRLK